MNERRNDRAWTSNEQVSKRTVCAWACFFGEAHWCMAVFDEADDKHVIVLVEWLGWGVGHALLPLFVTHADDEERSSLCPRGFRLTARAPSHRHGQVCTRTHDYPPTSTYAFIHSVATPRLPRPFVPLPLRHETINPLSSPTPHPPALLPFKYFTGRHRGPKAHDASATTRGMVRFVERGVGCCGLLSGGVVVVGAGG